MKAADVIDGTVQWSAEQADAIEWLRALPDGCARMCVTSPPYFGLRDYGHDGQIGLEDTPEEYVAKLVDVFREVRRVMTADSTLWLNIGDSYWGAKGQNGTSKALGNAAERGYTQPRGTIVETMRPQDRRHESIKGKDLIGIPWLVAFALRADGWYLRQDIIWHKPNPMPESVTDRCTKAHEYLFLLSKSSRYYFDADAIAEEGKAESEARYEYEFGGKKNIELAEANKDGVGRRTGVIGKRKPNGGASFGKQNHDTNGTGAQSRTYERPVYLTRNRRSVWTVTTKPYKGAHFATFPPDLIEPCIRAGSAPGDIVLEPFAGSGTTLAVAVGLGRRAIGCELNPKYLELTKRRMATVTPAMFG